MSASRDSSPIMVRSRQGLETLSFSRPGSPAGVGSSPARSLHWSSQQSLGGFMTPQSTRHPGSVDQRLLSEGDGDGENGMSLSCFETQEILLFHTTSLLRSLCMDSAEVRIVSLCIQFSCIESSAFDDYYYFYYFAYSDKRSVK